MKATIEYTLKSLCVQQGCIKMGPATKGHDAEERPRNYCAGTKNIKGDLFDLLIIRSFL